MPAQDGSPGSAAALVDGRLAALTEGGCRHPCALGQPGFHSTNCCAASAQASVTTPSRHRTTLAGVDYGDYLREVDRAAEATGGTVVSLAGGYFGVRLPAEGAHAVLALDLDSDQGWVAWTEDQLGERCCDAAEEVIGPCPLDHLRERALNSLAGHVHV